MLPVSPQQQDEYEQHSNEQITKNGKNGYLLHSNTNGTSGNTVISRDALILLPEGERVNAKIKDQSADQNEIKDTVQVNQIIRTNALHSIISRLTSAIKAI